jgi:hypothetical protein
MAIVKKDDVLQVRCRSEDLALFEHACRAVEIKPTECIRQFMKWYVKDVATKMARKAQYEAAKASRPGPVVAVPPEPEKSLVEPVRQPQSLSERRKAEKLAKQAKIAKREGRYLEE